VNTRFAAVKILISLSADGYDYEPAINSFVRSRDYTQPDRDFIYLLVKGAIQYRRLLDYLIDLVRPKSRSHLEKLARHLLRIGVLQIALLKTPMHAAVNETVRAAHQLKRPDLAPLINGILRHLPEETTWRKNLARYELPEALAIEYSHPDWLVQKWLADFGQENTIALLRFNNEYQAIFFRHNPLRISWMELEAKMQAEKYNIEVESTAPVVFFRVDRPGDLLKSEYFERGYCSVQDYSQALAVFLLDPQAGENILDACAAPGGKVTLIAQLTQERAKIVANDRSVGKIGLIKESACRLGIDSLNYSMFDAASDNFPRFDKILIDAPCTGTGVLSRRADLRWRRKSEDLIGIPIRQSRILDNLAGAIRQNGVLVYSTCSLEKEENHMLVRGFLERHPEFSVDTTGYVNPDFYDDFGAVSILPFKHGLTGSFAVRLVKGSG